MGKASRRKRKKRLSPLKEANASQEAQGILGPMASPKVGERQNACVALANCTLSSLKRLEKKGLYRAMLPRVQDSSWNVREQAIGALRSASMLGGDDTCERMFAEDIMTPCIALLESEKGEQALLTFCNFEKDLASRAAQSCVELLYNMCEVVDQAVQRLAQSNVLSLFVRCVFGSACKEVKVSVARLLHVCSEQSGEFARDVFLSSEQLSNIAPLLSSEELPLGCALNICGVLVNGAQAGKTTVPTDSVLELVLLIAKRALHTDAAFWSGDASPNGGWENQCLDQLLALEVLANSCAEASGGEGSSDVPLCTAACQKFIEHGMLSDCFSVLSSCADAAASEKTDSIIASTQQRAAGCVDNVVQNAPESLLSSSTYFDFRKAFELVLAWLKGCVSPNHSSPASGAIASLAFSLLRRMGASCSDVLRGMDDAALRPLLYASAFSQDTETRAASVASLGILAQQDALGSAARIRIAASIAKATSDPSDAVLVEALNAIFDVFGDDGTHQWFVESKVIELLSPLVGDLERRIRIDGRDMEVERLERLEETLDNLKRFIEYKTNF